MICKLLSQDEEGLKVRLFAVMTLLVSKPCGCTYVRTYMCSGRNMLGIHFCTGSAQVRHIREFFI